jgi:hypothetical protein
MGTIAALNSSAKGLANTYLSPPCAMGNRSARTIWLCVQVRASQITVYGKDVNMSRSDVETQRVLEVNLCRSGLNAYWHAMPGVAGMHVGHRNGFRKPRNTDEVPQKGGFGLLARVVGLRNLRKPGCGKTTTRR